jgi:putative transposase
VLIDQELSLVFKERKFTEKVVAKIKRVCSSELTGHVRSARGNVSGCYPSHKMTSSIQLESCMIELPFIYQIKHDDNVLE